MQEKSDKKIESLNKRRLERLLETQSRKDTLTLVDAANEKTDYFRQSFDEKQSEILAVIESSDLIAPKERPEHFDSIFKEILALQKYVAASNIFLRTYDIKIYQRQIQELTSNAKERETELMPKKRFGFKNKKSETKVCDVSPVEAKTNGNTSKVVIDEIFTGFKNETGKTLQLNGDDIFKKDVTLSNLKDCTVNIFGAPSTLHVSNLSRCKIFTGPVSTSIFADACINCTLVISCQQLRLHSSNDVHIYLHVTSRAIMEDCDKISLAPYNFSYAGIDEDYTKSGLDRTINNWDCVDDFNWLNIDKRSPHWSVLDENERVLEWTNGLTE